MVPRPCAGRLPPTALCGRASFLAGAREASNSSNNSLTFLWSALNIATASLGGRVAVVNGTLLAAGGPGADTAAFALPGLSTTPEPLASDPGRSYGLFVG